MAVPPASQVSSMALPCRRPRCYQNPHPSGGVCIQSPFPFAGQEPTNMLGVVLGAGLGLLILVLLVYIFVRWYQRGQCWHREYGQGKGASEKWDVGSISDIC